MNEASFIAKNYSASLIRLAIFIKEEAEMKNGHENVARVSR